MIELLADDDSVRVGERIRALEDLVRHCWVHSGYTNCGYDQMTTEQKDLYTAVIAKHEPETADE